MSRPDLHDEDQFKSASLRASFALFALGLPVPGASVAMSQAVEQSGSSNQQIQGNDGDEA